MTQLGSLASLNRRLKARVEAVLYADRCCPAPASWHHQAFVHSALTNTYNGTQALGFIESSRLHVLSMPFESACPHPLLQRQDKVSTSSPPSFKPPGYQG